MSSLTEVFEQEEQKRKNEIKKNIGQLMKKYKIPSYLENVFLDELQAPELHEKNSPQLFKDARLLGVIK